MSHHRAVFLLVTVNSSLADSSWFSEDLRGEFDTIKDLFDIYHGIFS